ncbi:MAG: Cys-tRNA(Pro) deacylase [Gammaproteobacteria bacterium]|nr:Cys-tRNA(Pro) deacylase [Gammaproteobacteria bacterium]
MTPGINQARTSGLSHTVHEYDHDPSCDSYGLEAATKMGVAEERVFKTLVVQLGSNELVVGVVPVSSKLSMKLIAKASGAKKAKMAAASDVERSTGYVMGGVSPLGQKKKLKTIVDCSAAQYPTIFISAGRRGLEIEMKPDDLVELTLGIFESIRQ